MRTRSSLRKKDCGRLLRQEEMVEQSSNAAGSGTGSFGADQGYSTPPANATQTGERENSIPTWHRSLICSEVCSNQEMGETQRSMRLPTPERDSRAKEDLGLPLLSYNRSFPDELATMIIDICSERCIGGLSGHELAEAFQDASDYPPVTQQSLGELDIQSIINNIRLRHDVNFDKDLSFRPNIAGVKGQEKARIGKKYWAALIAELVLYERLHQGSPQLRWQEGSTCDAITYHAQRRIPTLFYTIRDVLKSLVPDRDHQRVDEHLDVPMLMQLIQRGICDLVRLAEWMAGLLKEHCAPMRDTWVDAMVASITSGVTDGNPENIARGLRELLGILEAMKLDVANHQIRTLKTMLIEDSVNFQRHYHLDKLVNGRARVDVHAAKSWYAATAVEFYPRSTPSDLISARAQLEAFVSAVVTKLCDKEVSIDFPETFYLDKDRLYAIKAEIDDLVCVEICMDTFENLTTQLGYVGSISLVTGQQLRASLLAIMGEALGHGPQQWLMNCEALTLEILRQASCLIGQPSNQNFEYLADINQRLRLLLATGVASLAVRLKALLLPHIFACTSRYNSVSPMDLFSSLVQAPPSIPPSSHAPPALTSRPSVMDTLAFTPLHPDNTKLTDIANRLSHIIILHWRIWSSIAYCPEDRPLYASDSQEGDAVSMPSPASPDPTQHSPINAEIEPQVPTNMRTREPLDSGREAHVAHQASSR